MSYSTLQEQAFDFDPNAADSVLPSSMDKKPLADRLAAVRKLDPKQQATFFSTLNITQWEEAGDWFLDQFSQSLAKFREMRKKKRDAAQLLEQEVHKRQRAVEKNVQVIDAAMEEMKEDGQELLRANTPASKRRRIASSQE